MSWIRRTGLAQPTRDINHVIAYGQSLSNGWEGWPALSVDQPYDNLMLGDSVRPSEEVSVVWSPVGNHQLGPLRASVQGDDGLLSETQIAQLPPGHGARGETVLEGALNMWRGRMLERDEKGARPHRLLASSAGVGGRRIEAMSKHAIPPLFNRLRSCITQAHDAANRDGLSYGVIAMLLLQGEFNAAGIDGPASGYADFKGLQQQLYIDFVTEIAACVPGQYQLPALFTYQTGGSYSTSTLEVAQAQLDSALTLPWCFMAAPVYPVTDKGGHLDANGYRWLGLQFGKVMYRVLTLGEDWKPLHPRHIRYGDQRLEITFHVPVPPLAWGRPFQGHSAIDVFDHGFTVTDAAGVVTLETVELFGEETVSICLSRPLQGPATLRYADRRHGGCGALHDSDNDQAPVCYDMRPFFGAPVPADLIALAGRPYPLQNWCAAFTMAICHETPRQSDSDRIGVLPDSS